MLKKLGITRTLGTGKTAGTSNSPAAMPPASAQSGGPSTAAGAPVPAPGPRLSALQAGRNSSSPSPPSGAVTPVLPPPALTAHVASRPDAAALANSQVETTPRADVSLPHAAHRRERRRSSVGPTSVIGAFAAAAGGPTPPVLTGANSPALKELPLLRDSPPGPKREALFRAKLALCSVEFNWIEGGESDAAAGGGGEGGDKPPGGPAALTTEQLMLLKQYNGVTGVSAASNAAALAEAAAKERRGKEMKCATLVELVDYVNLPAGQKIFTEGVMEDVVAMVATNIFRALPSPLIGIVGPNGEELLGVGDGEGEEEAYFDPAWVHLQLVYEFFLRFIVSNEVKPKPAKKWIDASLCSRLIEMFDSEDPRERDYLKTILHRIYGKFMSHRSNIRKAIGNVFFRFVFETERHNGIGELLEILGSIINGFALPLKPEHVQFLEKALVPLHRPRSIGGYHQQLCYCITQYIEKDPSTVVPILRGITRSWPTASSAKQILLLNEVEELLELAGPDAVGPALPSLARILARCVGSAHFQVAERALFLWNNETLLSGGVLSKAYASAMMPSLFVPLSTNAAGHWNGTVETLAQSVLQHYREADPALYDACAAEAAGAGEAKAAARQMREGRWAYVRAKAEANAAAAAMAAERAAAAAAPPPHTPTAAAASLSVCSPPPTGAGTPTASAAAPPAHLSSSSDIGGAVSSAVAGGRTSAGGSVPSPPSPPGSGSSSGALSGSSRSPAASLPPTAAAAVASAAAAAALVTGSALPPRHRGDSPSEAMTTTAMSAGAFATPASSLQAVGGGGGSFSNNGSHRTSRASSLNSSDGGDTSSVASSTAPPPVHTAGPASSSPSSSAFSVAGAPLPAGDHYHPLPHHQQPMEQQPQHAGTIRVSPVNATTPSAAAAAASRISPVNVPSSAAGTAAPAAAAAARGNATMTLRSSSSSTTGGAAAASSASAVPAASKHGAGPSNGTSSHGSSSIRDHRHASGGGGGTSSLAVPAHVAIAAVAAAAAAGSISPSALHSPQSANAHAAAPAVATAGSGVEAAGGGAVVDSGEVGDIASNGPGRPPPHAPASAISHPLAMPLQ